MARRRHCGPIRQRSHAAFFRDHAGVPLRRRHAEPAKFLAVKHYAFIDEHNGRPCPHTVAVPNLETVVLNHGIFYTERRRGFLDSRERSFPEKLGRMNAYDR